VSGGEEAGGALAGQCGVARSSEYGSHDELRGAEKTGAGHGLGRLFCIGQAFESGPEYRRAEFCEGNGPATARDTAGRVEDLSDLATAERAGGRVIRSVREREL